MPVHPNSLANLTSSGSVPARGEPKKKRNIAVTDTAWVQLRQYCQELGISVSEAIERIGRGEYRLEPNLTEDKDKSN
ncbi:MAG: hypothetical protein QNJ41_09520 [Xenococcaceae cyanobacterium MO_188.B32]|nr:hypothetical protein [Xenococcaceae cyanobacterium MO_188.B32]